MKTDNEKLLELDKVIDDAISKIEDIGEFKDYDIDQKVESIYNKLEDLSIDVFEILVSKGLAEEDRDLW